jgi:hypothetical protein
MHGHDPSRRLNRPAAGAGVVILALLTVSCVLPTRFSEPGPYIAGSLLAATDDFDRLVDDSSNGDDTVAGFGIRGGGRFLPWFSGEIAYEELDEFELRPTDVKMRSVAVQAKFNPLAGRLQPYGMLGLGWASARARGADIDDSDYLVRGGVGLDWYLLQKLGLFAELAYTDPRGDLEGLSYWTGSIGAIFKF